MAKLSINAGATSQTINVWLQDSSSTIGAGLSGLAYNTSGLKAYYVLPLANSAAITLATQTVTGSWATGGFVEIDATNCKGLYRFDIPNAAIASGRFSTIFIYGATNLAPCVLEIDLQANTYAIAGTAQTARDIGASVLLSTGTGTGQLDFTSGVVKCNNVQWLGGTIPAVNVTGVPLVDAKYLLGTVFATPATAGLMDVNAKQWNGLTTVALPLVPTTAGRTLDVSTGGEAGIDWANIGSPTTTNNLSGTTVATVTNQLTGAEMATAIWTDTTAGDFTTALSVGKSIMNGVTLGTGLTVAAVSGAVGSVTGAVGSVTGAVGSVTGNVGGNVTGSVGSVAANGITSSSLATDAINAASVKADAVTKIQSGLATPTNITAGTITTVTNLTNAPTSGDFTSTMKTSLVTAIWDSAIGGHTGAGTFGGALNSASSAGDPWNTALPGAYAAGTAGYIVGTNLDATVSSRGTSTLTQTQVTGGAYSIQSSSCVLGDARIANLDAAVTTRMATYTQPTGFLAATFPSGTVASTTNITAGVITTTTNLTNLPAITSNWLTAAGIAAGALNGKGDWNTTTPPTANENADALLKRDWTAVTGEASRSTLNALRFIRNKFSTSVTPGSVTIYKEDDTTVAYTKTIVTDAAAEPIVQG